MPFDYFFKQALMRFLLIASIILLAFLVSCSPINQIDDSKMFTEQYVPVTPKQAKRIQKRFKAHTGTFPIYEDKYLTLTKEQVETRRKHLKTSLLGRRFSKQLQNEQ